MDIFSNLQVIGECLLDKRRTDKYLLAINNKVKNSDIVLELGTGSGILTMAAAKKAKKVITYEIADDIWQIAKQNFKYNDFKNILALQGDATRIDLKERITVVIAEMLDTGLIAEQQTQAINNLIRKRIISKDTIIIPNKMSSYLQLIDYDYLFYNYKMPFVIQARNYGALKRINKKLSKLHCYEEIGFNAKIDEKVKIRQSIKIEYSGYLNAVCIKSKISLTDKLRIFGTSDMNMPVIIPLKPKKVIKGEDVLIELEYRKGGGFQNVKVELS